MRPFAAVLAALTAVLLAAAPAGAVVVPQKSIAGIRLSMTVEQVRAARGAPDRTTFEHNEILGRVRVMHYGRTAALFDGAGQHAHVVTVRTTSVSQRTAQGVGMGSLRATVAKKVPGVRCRVESGLDHCYVGRFVAGKRVTDFRLGRNGRVNAIVVGIVID